MKNNTQRTAIMFLDKLFYDGIDRKKALVEFNIKDVTFHKYIRQIKDAGFVIQYKEGVYSVLNFSKDIEFNPNDDMIFVNLLLTADNYLSRAKAKIFKENMLRVIEHSDFDSYINIKNKYEKLKEHKYEKTKQKKIEILQNYISNNKTLEIKIKHGALLLIKPLELVFEKNRVFLNYINRKEKTTGKIPIEFLAKISVVEDNGLYIDSIKETIFELKGKLALSYILKENERVVDKFKDRIVVGNSSNNKKDLFKRLLRYDIFCKILFPKQDVKDFRDFVKDSLKNIEQC